MFAKNSLSELYKTIKSATLPSYFPSLKFTKRITVAIPPAFQREVMAMAKAKGAPLSLEEKMEIIGRDTCTRQIPPEREMEQPRLFIVDRGFYFFGNLMPDPPEGYIKVDNLCMSAGFSGGMGIAGICRGDKASTVKLDAWPAHWWHLFPLHKVLGIIKSINVYKFVGAELRESA